MQSFSHSFGDSTYHLWWITKCRYKLFRDRGHKYLCRDILVGIASVAIGIAAISLTLSARRRMSNPRLLGYMRSVILATTSLTAFSVLHTAKEAFGLDVYGAVIEVPEQLFILLANALFLYGAWLILRMSREYGFREQGKRMAAEAGKDAPGKKPGK